YAFSHYRFGHLGHVHLLSHQWLALMLLGLHRAVASGGRWRDVGLVALAFALQALSSAYYAYFALLAGALFALWFAGPAAPPPLASRAGAYPRGAPPPHAGERPDPGGGCRSRRAPPRHPATVRPTAGTDPGRPPRASAALRSPGAAAGPRLAPTPRVPARAGLLSRARGPGVALP